MSLHWLIVLNQHRSKVVDPIEVRKLLEPQIAKLSAERASEGDIVELERLLNVQRLEIETTGIISPVSDFDFHRCITASTGNYLLITILDLTRTLLQEIRQNTLSTSEASRLSLHGHIKILNAIRSRKPDKSYDAMSDHLEDVSSLNGIRREVNLVTVNPKYSMLSI